MKKIVVVGGGTMGLDIAHTFARSGHAVVVREISDELAEKSHSRLVAALDKLVARGKMDEAKRAEILGNMTFTTDPVSYTHLDVYKRQALYDTNEAMELIVKTAPAKFDETVELHVKLGVDSRHADQQVRGAIVLPHGTGTVSYTHLDVYKRQLTDSGPGPHGGLPIPLHIIGMAPPGHAALPAAEEPQSDHQHAHRREGKQKDQRQDPVRQVTHPSARAPAGLPFSAVVLISLISVICHHSASPGVLLYRIPDPSQNNIDFFLKFLENFSSGSGPLSSTYTILSYCREGEK